MTIWVNRCGFICAKRLSNEVICSSFRGIFEFICGGGCDCSFIWTGIV